jgi:SPP1 family predicted phage head-tail adaptor
MKKISIGDLRHRITFQKPDKVPDGYKGHTVKWLDVVTVWASVEPLSGREYFYAHQIKNEVSHRVRVRYREDVTAEMRIKISEDRALAIESIIDLEERHQFLEILCREKK